MDDPIKRWCDDTGKTAAWLAQAIGKKPALISDFRHGRCRLSDKTKLDIVRVTGGKITIEQLTLWQADAA